MQYKQVNGKCYCEQCRGIFKWGIEDRHSMLGNVYVECPQCGYKNILKDYDYYLTMIEFPLEDGGK